MARRVDFSTCAARSPNISTSAPLPSIIVRRAGMAVASPASARRTKANRSALGSATALAFLVSGTGLPPLAALMALIPGDQQRGAGQPFGQHVHIDQRAVDCGKFGIGRALGVPAGFPLRPFEVVELGRDFGHGAGTDV